MLRYALPLVLALAGCGVGFDSTETVDPTGPGAGGGGMTPSVGGGGSGGEGARGGEGGVGGEGGADVDCLVPLADDFSSASLDTTKWNNFGVQTGAGVAGISWSGAIDQYGTMRSANRYDMRDCAAFIELSTPPTTGGAQAFMYIGENNENRVGYWMSNGTLHFAMRVAGSGNQTSATFDAVAHRFWRIRETAGTVFWETSPDALTWTEGRQADTPDVSLDNGEFNIGAGTLAATSAGEAAFDNFNTVP